jgi:hypothetical protein
MALGNFVVTADTTVAAGAVTRDVTDGNRTGGVTTSATGWSAPWGTFYKKGTIVYADSAGTGSAAGLLYAAIGAGNLRAAVAGDLTGRDGISN